MGLHRHPVELGDAAGRVHHRMGEGAVVGHQQEALTVFVQAAHRIQPGRDILHQVHDGLAAQLVADGGHIAAGLIQSQIIEAQTEEVSKIEHLGRREYRLGFLHNKYHFKTSTLELFKKKYPHQKWKQIVDESFVIAKKEAVKDIKRKSEIQSAKEEIQHIIAAQVSSKLFYQLENDNIDEIQKKYELIYDCISKPKLKLESACFVWMVK